MIGVGIIGAGNFGHEHAKAIVKNPSTELIAASRRNEAELNNFISCYNILGYKDYKELLKNDSIDVVVIATPHDMHHHIAVDAAKAGKHILLEKPMAHNLPACDQIIKATDTYQVKLMIAHIIRYMPAFSKAKQMLDDGIIGKLVYANAHFARKWDTPNRRSWHYKHNLGGGMLKTGGIHYIDLMCWIYGSEVTSVRAFISNPFFQKDADDATQLFISFKNGKSGLLTNSGFQSGGRLFEIVITGTKGMIKADLIKGVWLGQNDKWEKVYTPDIGDKEVEEGALVQEWKDFSNKLLSGEPVPISGEYGRHMIEIVEAAHKSSQSGQEILIV